jgi:carbonic anhydrase/acetyltransferase-like protein (isoleucine patch superfamily)
MRKKYKLLARTRAAVTFPKSEGSDLELRHMTLRRIRALVDIPRHGVKAGDIGGYVSDAHTLSQVGDCWIGGDAVVAGNARVIGNSIVSEEAGILAESRIELVIGDNAKIDGCAFVHYRQEFSEPDYFIAHINENAHIFGNAYIQNALYISGSVQIFDDARIENSKYIADSCIIREKAFLRGDNSVTGTSEIFGTTTVAQGTIIAGNSKIGTSGKSLYVPANKKLVSVTMGARDAVTVPDLTAARRRNINEIMHQFKKSGKNNTAHIEELQKSIKAPSSLSSDDQTISIQTLDEITTRIEIYQKDIVKIIKYPLMVDTTDPFTAKMMMLFNKAQRLRSFSDNKKFSDVVDALEEAFLAAEANALRLASTKLSEDEQKKTAKATDLLRIAMDNAASENEKQVAFKQGLKQLEGIILVPENAIETFRVNAGIAQLTA